MKLITLSPVLFGVDLRRLGRDWLLALHGMAQWPGVRLLSPCFPVRLRFPDHSELTVIEHPNGAHLVESDNIRTSYEGLVVAQEHLLWHVMPTVGLGAQDLANAVELEVQRLSPFPSGEYLHAHFVVDNADEGRKSAFIAITSQKLLVNYFQAKTAKATAHSDPKEVFQPELWVELPNRKTLFLLPGYGELRRRRRTHLWRVANLSLLSLTVLTIAATALTPSLQMRERVQQAHRDYTQLQQMAAPAQQSRERLVTQQDKVRQLQKLVGDRLVPENILLLLTQYLPDDTYILVLEAKADRINLVGVTSNANQLVLHLEKQAGVKRVATVTPARKEGAREVFTIEFVLDTAAAALAIAANGSSPSIEPARKP